MTIQVKGACRGSNEAVGGEAVGGLEGDLSACTLGAEGEGWTLHAVALADSAETMAKEGVNPLSRYGPLAFQFHGFTSLFNHSDDGSP